MPSRCLDVAWSRLLITSLASQLICWYYKTTHPLNPPPKEGVYDSLVFLVQPLPTLIVE